MFLAPSELKNCQALYPFWFLIFALWSSKMNDTTDNAHFVFRFYIRRHRFSVCNLSQLSFCLLFSLSALCLSFYLSVFNSVLLSDCPVCLSFWLSFYCLSSCYFVCPFWLSVCAFCLFLLLLTCFKIPCISVVPQLSWTDLPPRLGNFFLFHLNVSFRETRET